LAVGDALGSTYDDAVGNIQVLLLDPEALARLLQQRGLGSRRGLADLDAADLDREAAPGRTLFWRRRRVTLNHRAAPEGYGEFLGGDLRQRCLDAGAEIDLAGKERHSSLGVDHEIGIDLGQHDRLGWSRALPSGLVGQ